MGDQWPYSVAWSPEGDKVASGTSWGWVQIWYVESGEMLKELKSREISEAISLGWSSDGNIIAEGLLNGDILLWDANSGRLLNEISRYTSRRSDVNGLAWSPDGEVLATAHQDGRIRLWNIESGELIWETKGHGGWARGVAWPRQAVMAKW
jgi:WD40 repeat protein